MITIEQLNGQLFEAVEGMAGEERVRELLAAGAEANACVGDGMSVLLCAVSDDEPDEGSVRALLAAGADPNAHGKSALLEAVGSMATPGVVRALLEAGAEVNYRGAYGDHVMDYIMDDETHRLLRAYGAEEPEEESADLAPELTEPEQQRGAHLLLDRARSADPLSESWVERCLYLGVGSHELSAALRDSLVWGPKASVVRLLLSAGADPNEPDADGYTALHKALEFHAVSENVRELLTAGADPFARNANGLSPREMAEQPGQGFEYYCSVEEVVRLLREGEAAFAPRRRAADMAEQLFLALHAGREDEVMALLAAGAPVNAHRHLKDRREKDDYSVIEYALHCRATPRCIRALLEAGALPTPRILPLAIDRENRLETIEMILETGADANGRDEELRTALMHAAISGDNIRVFRALRAAGADVHARDENDNTVLHHMLGNLHTNTCVLRLLLEAGADMQAANNRGVTPLMLAAKSEDPRLRAYLGAVKK